MNTETIEKNKQQAKVRKPSENDFYWSDEREPHFQRRQDILKDHPEVKELFGIDPMLKYTTVLLVTAQLTIGYFIDQVSWIWFFVIAYFIGAAITHALFLAVHEITHDLAFKKKSYNNMLSFIANLPMVAPYAMAFKKYHAMHHWEQGKDGVDTDIPTETEAKIFRGLFGKIVWFLHQILFYALRPMFVKSLKFDKWMIRNWIFQVVAIGTYFYLAGPMAALYLFVSMLLAGSLHPTSGHFISEHYVFEEGQETYSYYGPLNLITFNVGYHNEHHDFPRIPGSRLPKLKKMAPEYYDNLHSYNSWTKVIPKFLFDRKINLYSRTKRK